MDQEKCKAQPSLRFHNNTVAVAIVHDGAVDELPANAFGIVQRCLDDDGNTMSEGTFVLGRHYPSVVLDFGRGDFVIRRLPDGEGVVAIIVNTGIRNISFEYELEERGEFQRLVGPSTDTLPMGHFREIGCGPNLAWKVTTFRGTNDPRHAAMRR